MGINPTHITVHKGRRELVVHYEDGKQFHLPAEYLRVYSPSAEVRAYQPIENMRLVPGKSLVNINTIEPVGQYAVKLVFDDGHDSGIYTWDTLYELGIRQVELWKNYLERMKHAGVSRVPVEESPNEN